MLSRKVIILLLTIILSAILVQPTLAGPLGAPNKGEILQLLVQGAENPGDPIVIDSLSVANEKVPNSNFYYEVYSPSMVLLDTHEVKPGWMDPGDTFPDNWQSYNTPDTGNYTVTLCWSTGQAHNCDIDYVETIEYSVPTMGVGLSLLAASFLGVLLWRNRDHFQGVTV